MVKQAEKVNIEVPSDLVDKVTEYMNILSVGKSEGKAYEDDNTEITEVVAVCDHRRYDGDRWEFKLKWKGGGYDWVKDEDCNCEHLINQYIHKINMTTNYLVCRVSTKEQGEETHTSLAAQEAELISKTRTHENVRRKIVKIRASAFKGIPKELEKIAEACQIGDELYIWRADRLTRNIVKYLEWLEYFDSMCVKVMAVSENLTYRDNKLEFIQAVVNAQGESELLGKRVRLSYKHRRDRGDTHVGSLPYGKKYKVVRENGRVIRKCVVDHPDEIAIISAIKNSRTDSITLMHELNAKGVKKRGRKWTHRMIHSIKKK